MGAAVPEPTGMPIFVGDEVSGAGFRLAGAEVRIPVPGKEAETLERACADAELVLLGTDTARAIAPAVLAAALARLRPALVLVEDIRGRAPLPDPSEGLRRRLGLGEE
jgi:vacuolar-type H+-ATPase subunit F/Vma7